VPSGAAARRGRAGSVGGLLAAGGDYVTEPLVEIVAVSKAFPIRGGLIGGLRGEVRAVNEVSFRIARGEAFGLAGESGSGKSTIARMILGLETPTAGAILIEGRDFAGERNWRRRASVVQMVFQNPGSSLNPRRSIGQSIEVPLTARGLGVAERRRRVAELIDQVQLPASFAERYPYELSGGQKQRVAIARALAAEPKLIVLDEPTSALDVSVQAKIIELLDALRSRLGLTYIFISHDLSLMRAFADRVGILYLGRLIETGPAAAVFDRPAHPYTRSLISAVPVVSDAEEALKPKAPLIEGEIPNPADMPDGCAFHPRCPHALAICHTEIPKAEPAGVDHFARCVLLKGPQAAGAPSIQTLEESGP
jgi:peptide/nickel transport system ATP-binding protein